jgi:outer membrane protein assembly factor BamB
MRLSLRLALGLLVAACGSSGGGGGSGSAGGGGGIPPASDAGAPDAGSPDAGPAPLGGGDWLQYRNSPLGGTSENPGIFAAGAAASVAPLWSIPSDRFGVSGSYYYYSQPLIAGDTVYFATAFGQAGGGKVVAVNAADGSTRWASAFPGAITVDSSCSSTPMQLGFWSAPALAGGTLYVAAVDGKVYALDPSNGATLWSAQVADPTPAGRGQFIVSSPAVSTALGKLYVGIASAIYCSEVDGRVVSVDLRTHAVQGASFTDPGAHTGAVWTSVSIDEGASAIYASTGTGKQLPILTPTSLSQAIVRLDASTLAVVAHWQNPCPLSDCDFGGSPTLFAAGGTNYLAATSKDGWLYVLNRDALAAGPVWKYQLAIVDPSHATEGGDATNGWGTLSTPTFAGGTLYAAGGQTPDGHPGSVVAFDPTTKDPVKVKWRHVTPGYVLTAMPAVGEVLMVASSTPSSGSNTSWLEILAQSTGDRLKIFDGAAPTYGAPSAGHGLIVWPFGDGEARALAAPQYR